MENYKLKMRIGDHEFDAEGPGDIVQAQFAVFRELVEAAAKTPAPTPTVVTAAESTPPSAKNGELMLDKIMRMEGRVVSLTARGIVAGTGNLPPDAGSAESAKQRQRKWRRDS